MSSQQNVRENLLLALDTLRSHKFRSFLTILGVLIGVTTVIVVASVFKGLDQQVVDAAQDFGTNILYIFKFQPGIHIGQLSREERMRKPLSYEDAMAIRDECPAVRGVAVSNLRFGPPSLVKYKGQDMVDGILRGLTAEGFAAINASLADGRLFTDIDNLHRRDVTVIGADVVKRFFVHEDPVGKALNVEGHNLEIIGTLGERKEVLGDNPNNRIVFIPYLTYKKFYPADKENFVFAQTYEGKLNEAIDQVTELLRRRRNLKPWEPDNFGIGTAESVISQFRGIMGTVVLVSVVISSIGLLVGGIGVMNIMLVSVTERTREIGVRKAVGARRSDITWQFLLEAITLSLVGGVLGIALGCTVSFSIRTFVPALPSTVPVWSVLVGFLVSISIGLFFGMWPALKASRLDPIVALRYE